MDTRHMQYILTIAEDGSLLTASEKLYVTPSALSQLVSRVENELHVTLFNRSKKGWFLTHAGHIFADMAKEILIRERDAYLQISDIAETRVGHFSVGVTAGRGTRMFASVFPKFQAEYPNVKVSLVEGSVLEINKQISAGKIDLGFIPNILQYPNVATQHQAYEKIVLAVPHTHPVAALYECTEAESKPPITLSCFKDDEFLMAGEGTTLRALADQAFAKAGFQPKKIFETHSISTLHALATSGFGLSFVPEFYTRGNTTAMYFNIDPVLTWELVAASRQGRYLTQAEQAFSALVAAYYHQSNSAENSDF